MVAPKFRAWSKAEKIMSDVKKIDFCNCEIDARSFEETEIEEVILMQSTGLRDVNGKEIFEGDILKVTDEHSWLEVVEYNDKKAVFVSEEVNRKFKTPESPLYELFGTNIFKVEVIGNIYENPELLK